MTEYIVPGRVELVGKHVDYAGGRSLTCAVDRALHIRARALSEPLVRVRSNGWDGVVESPLDPGAARGRDTPPWGTYINAVARRFARDFPAARRGVEIEVRSELPASAGLSSSSALVVGVGMALVDVNEMIEDERWREVIPDQAAMAEYFAAMETGAPFGPFAGDDGVGVRGGGQDHVAILCAEVGQVSQFIYMPARLERRVEWPSDHVLAIGVTGVEATKTGNALRQYNRASDATTALVEAWNAHTGRSDATLADALRSSATAQAELELVAATRIGEFSAFYLSSRLTQFRLECEVIVPAVAAALAGRDFIRLRALVERSQRLAESALENQVAETIHLTRSAIACGAVASSAFGAGFGGAVWAMTGISRAEQFVAAWHADYSRAFPHRADDSQWLITRPAAAAHPVT